MKGNLPFEVNTQISWQGGSKVYSINTTQRKDASRNGIQRKHSEDSPEGGLHKELVQATISGSWTRYKGRIVNSRIIGNKCETR